MRFGGQVVRHRRIGQRGGKQDGTIAELAPQVAPDVGRVNGGRLKQLEQPVVICRACGGSAIKLAQRHRGPIAQQDAPWPQPVSTKIDEAAHGSFGTDGLGDDQFIETVLRGQHRALVGQMRFEG